ncbi:MAG TPA: FAD-dependent monooxygenase [Hyphomicrobiaceae bacterium]|nr:FAD-dependent monooxygenase [Hyphomicrobiaceae bacterium]
MMPRADLYVALGKLARDRGARVNYGKKFVDAATTAGGGVQARFADGTTAEGDLLLGCDGIHSQVRQIIDSNAPAPRYVAVLNTGGYIPKFGVDVPAKEFPDAIRHPLLLRLVSHTR